MRNANGQGTTKIEQKSMNQQYLSDVTNRRRYIRDGSRLFRDSLFRENAAAKVGLYNPVITNPAKCVPWRVQRVNGCLHGIARPHRFATRTIPPPGFALFREGWQSLDQRRAPTIYKFLSCNLGVVVELATLKLSARQTSKSILRDANRDPHPPLAKFTLQAVGQGNDPLT
jgi:hypothetical protein